MSHWINGIGPLTVNGSAVGAVEYKILGERSQANGSMWADTDVLYEAYTSGDVRLTLDDGKQIEIAVISYTPGADAKFAVNTPMH